MKKNYEEEELDLSEKYKLEYVISLVAGCFEPPGKESGCCHSCGAN